MNLVVTFATLQFLTHYQQFVWKHKQLCENANNSERNCGIICL